MINARKKIVLVTPACDGSDVGEAFVAAQWATHLSKLHDLTILTTRNPRRPSVSNQFPNAKVVEWTTRFGRLGRFASMLKPGYVFFYLQVRRWLRAQIAEGERFDVVHQVGPVAMRYPSPAIGLGLPVIIGPVGGCLEAPQTFANELRAAPWYTKLRRLDEWRLRNDLFLRRTYSKADLIIGVAPYVQTLLADIPYRKFEVMFDVGVNGIPDLDNSPKRRNGCHILFVGRLTRSKGARDAIRAMGYLASRNDWHLDILGDGEDRANCIEEARALSISDRVSFHGKLPRATVDSFYRKADIFLFPSLREPSSNVIIEAMSYGIPSVVADRGGPGFVVTEECGIRVTPKDPSQFAASLGVAVQQLMDQPERRRQLGKAARERIAQEFLWDRKVEEMSQFYDHLLIDASEV